MTIALITIAGLVLAGLTFILAGRAVLSVSVRNARLEVILATVGCGLKFDSDGNRLALFCGRWSREIKFRWSDLYKPKDKKTGMPLRAVKRLRSYRRLPFSIIVKIIKADLLCAARLLSRVQYEEVKLNWQPVIVNPALAGMAFGWGQAVNGIFPGLRRVFDFSPSCKTGKESFSGKAVFSIKNRQIAYIMWRLIRDLPIKEIIKYRFFRREVKNGQ